MQTTLALPHLWLPNLPPRKGLTITAFFALILIIATAHLAIQQPSLGIVWNPTKNNRGLLVEKCATTPTIPTGTRIVSILGSRGRRLMLDNDFLIEDPDQYTTYSAYNDFFTRQRRLMTLYMQETVTLIAEDGRQWSLPVRMRDRLNRIPLSFWLLNLSAAVCFLIGCGVWWYRRGEVIARLMAVTAVCYFLSILCLSIYSARELAMDAAFFRVLSAANHLFTVTWCYSLLLMFIHYPSQIAGAGTTLVVYLFAFIVWLNQTLQWYECPIHAYYGLNHIGPYAVGTALGGIQWIRTAGRPVERAALRWFILSIWISTGLSGSLFIVPSLVPQSGTFPLWIPALSILLMFVGFAFGILRYGLFNLERWWFTGWVWLAAGLLITAIDGILVFLLDMGFRTILPYSILLLGWIYFPLRQWMWRRLVQPEIYRLEHHLPALIQSLFGSGSMQAFIDQWAGLLKQIFNPLHIMVEHGTSKSVAIDGHGLVLQIPGLDHQNLCRLVGNRRGTRLFGQKDVKLAEALLTLSHAIFAIANRTREVQQKGAADERERIMRDLHDDVLPKIITIKQQSPKGDITRLAEAAFQSIRETIYILRYPTNKPLEDALANWRAETAERLACARLKMHWHTQEKIDAVQLSPRQFINCGRILREALSNIIQHAEASDVHILFRIDQAMIHLCVSDNGKGVQAKRIKGLGTANMRLRATALDGTITWKDNEGDANGLSKGLTIELSFPLGSLGNGPTAAMAPEEWPREGRTRP